MLMQGTSLTTAADPLKATDIVSLWKNITQPDDAFTATIARLRALKSIDQHQYSAQKRTLPYFVAGVFNPAIRKKEHFAFINHFILDIDHLSSKDVDPLQLRHQLQSDERVCLCFTSPGGDGLKLVFRLQERCYDAGLYAIFYRAFAHQFSEQYHLDQVLDFRTNDVTRACFLSFDPLAYHNPFATPVVLEEFVDTANVQETLVFDQNLQTSTPSTPATVPEKLPIDPDSETLERIKVQLKQRRALIQATQQYPIVVPEMLEEVIAEVTKLIQEASIEVTNIENIQYGKKIKVKLGIRLGEVNLFYGRRGFSVVPTPKRGCSPDLNEAVTDLLKAYFCIP